MNKYRKRAVPHKDRRIFSNTAGMTHKKNLVSTSAMRGGIRL